MKKPLITLPKLTLKALFDHSISAYSDLPAVTFAGEEALTYRDVAKKVEKVQKVLQKYGIRQGDKVALYSENMPNWSIIYFAVTTMGAVIVPILPDFHISEAIHIANHAECRAAFISIFTGYCPIVPGMK